MRISIICMLFLGVIVFSATPSQASLLRNDIVPVEGYVVAKDVKTKQLTIHELSTGQSQVFVASDENLAAVQEGDKIILLHKKGSDVIRLLNVTLHKAKGAYAK